MNVLEEREDRFNPVTLAISCKDDEGVETLMKGFVDHDVKEFHSDSEFVRLLLVYILFHHSLYWQKKIIEE